MKKQKHSIALSAVVSVSVLLLLLAGVNAGSGSAASLGGLQTASLDAFTNNATVPTPGFQATPSSVDFGVVEVDITAGPTTVTVQNTGTGPLTFNPAAITLVGTNVADFSLSVGTCGSATVAPDDTCSVAASFTPLTVGPKSASIRFENSLGAAYFVLLTGEGFVPGPPVFSVSPTSVAFGSQNVGSNSSPVTLTVTNTGGADLDFGPGAISLVTDDTTDFDLLADTCSNSSVAADDTCTVQVRFGPTATGPRSSNVRFQSNAASSPDSVPVSGMGRQPVFSGNPGSIFFRTQALTTTSVGRAVTVTNTGDGPLTFSSVSLTGASPADFAVSANACVGVLAPAASCVTTVAFGPTVLGLREAELTYVSDAPGSPHQVDLTGYGSYVSLSDNFNAANGAWPVSRALTGQSPLAPAASWTVAAGAFSINANQAAPTGGNTRHVATVQWGGPDVSVQAALTLGQDNRWVGLLTNVDATQGTALRIAAGAGNPDWQLGTVVIATGAFANLVCDSGSPTGARLVGTATWRLDYIDGTYSVYRNNVFQGSCTVPPGDQVDIDSRTRVGLYASRSGNQRWDNFNASAASAPGLGAAPNPVVFGSQKVDEASSPVTVTVTNTGNADLTFGPGAVTIAGGDAGDFARVDGCSNQVLAPSATCTIDVTFTPSAAGARASSLEIVSDAGSSPDTVDLSGTGVTPEFSVAPTTVDFGYGEIDDTSVPTTLTVTNTGLADLDFGPSAITLTGSDPSDFVLVDGCSNQSVAPSSTCTVDVAFAPTQVGVLEANVQFDSDAPSSPDTVGVTGFGLPADEPWFTVTPEDVDFGSESVGSNSAATDLTVTNIGSAALVFGPGSITVATGDTSDFTITSDTCTNQSIAPDASCTVEVRFNPTAAGARASAVEFVSNAFTSPDLVTTAGFGTAPVFTRSPASLDFGDVYVTSDSRDDTVSVTNTGDDTLVFTSITVTGANAADFVIQAGGCQTLPNLGPGASCILTVRFDPSALGVRNAQVDFVTDGGSGSTSLTGTGVPLMYEFVSDDFAGANNTNLAGLVIGAGEWGPADATAGPPGPWTTTTATLGNALRLDGANRVQRGSSIQNVPRVGTLNWDDSVGTVCSGLTTTDNASSNWVGVGMHFNANMNSGVVLRMRRSGAGGGGTYQATIDRFNGNLGAPALLATSGNWNAAPSGVFCLSYDGSVFRGYRNGTQIVITGAQAAPNPPGPYRAGIYGSNNNTTVRWGGTVLTTANTPLAASQIPDNSRRFLVAAP